MYYVTMQIKFFTRKFRNVECHLLCDVVHITTKWVSSLTLDCNDVFAIKAYAIHRCGRWSDVTLSSMEEGGFCRVTLLKSASKILSKNMDLRAHP